MRSKTLSQLMVVVVGTLFVVTSAYAEQLVLKYRNVQQKNDVTMHSQSKDSVFDRIYLLLTAPFRGMLLTLESVLKR